ncbi:MAG: hypothetical protein U1F26_16465 [Lysobacterales bacterium]
MDFHPFVGVGLLNFGNVRQLPAMVGGAHGSMAPGKDRLIYDEAGITVFFYSDGLIEFIGVASPAQVSVGGVAVLGLKLVEFIAAMCTQDIRGSTVFDGIWLASDRSFSVRMTDGIVDQLTAYSREYLSRGTSVSWANPSTERGMR